MTTIRHDENLTEGPAGRTFGRSDAEIFRLSIRIVVIAVLGYMTLAVVTPFAPIFVWSVTLAVSLYPVYAWLTTALKERRIAAAVILTALGLLVVIGPIAWLGVDLLDVSQELVDHIELGLALLPPPPAYIKTWAVIGEPLFHWWNRASTHLQAALTPFMPQLQVVGEKLLAVAGSAGQTTVNFSTSLVVMGVLLPFGPSLAAMGAKLAQKIDPEHGETFVRVASATIRSVSRGVIGISALEAILAGTAMALAGLPGASFLAFAIFFLAILQIGPIPVAIPILVWAWNSASLPYLLALALCMAAITAIDGLLKPYVMGRGKTAAMILYTIGIIGGVMTYGMIGVFLGPIVLAISYDLMRAWLD